MENESTVESFRRMEPWENNLLKQLFNAPFQGSRELSVQTKTAMVRTIDNEGSLELKIEDGKITNVRQRIPVEAWYRDSDGVEISCLLHVVNGFANELEIYKVDGSEIIVRQPSVHDLSIFSPHTP